MSKKQAERSQIDTLPLYHREWEKQVQIPLKVSKRKDSEQK